MGFLHESQPVAWEEAMESLQYVRDHGLEQFLSIYRRCAPVGPAPFRWGDEVEHQIFRLRGAASDEQRDAKVSLRSLEIMKDLQQLEQKGYTESEGSGDSCNWMPEYGRWMLESTPGRPYDGLDGVVQVESHLQLRRSRLNAALQAGEFAPTLTAFPIFGVGDFCEPSQQPRGPAMESLFVPDEVIFPHPRFPTLARHIRERRGSKVEIRRPLMTDLMTPLALHTSDSFVPQTVEEADAMGHVYADAMAFGMGSSCLQVTMQAADIGESRRLYDQLAPLTPVLLALTAATPFLRGWICDDDVRWGQIEQSVDDRTPAERGVEALENSGAKNGGDPRLAGSGTRRLAKSRYGGIDCYIGEAADASKYNDVPMALDKRHVERLTESGVDEVLAHHVAHLFARDPLVIFGDRIELDDREDVDHWENLQSTNWQTLRWKPPPPAKGALNASSDAHIGWRVEFRSMELQLTDFENAAFISFLILLSRVLLELKVDLRIPISQLDENMRTAQQKDAYLFERFWFRTDLGRTSTRTSEAQWALLTAREIMQGTDTFTGLVPLCRAYLDASDGLDTLTRATLEKHLEFVTRRADGRIPTAAAWMRRFVMSHPAYAQDSRVPAAAVYDLVIAAHEVGQQQSPTLEFLERFYSPGGCPCGLGTPSSAELLARPSCCASECRKLSTQTDNGCLRWDDCDPAVA